MQYAINIITNKIVSDEILGSSFRAGDWRECSQEEIDDYELQKAKAAKITEIKGIRDQLGIADMTSHQATELTPDELGNFTEGEKVYFAFRTFSTSNPTTEPTAILTNVMVKNSILATEGVETNHFIPYSCKIVEGEISRGGYIKLDYALAKELVVHLENRNTSDIKHTNELEILINNSATVEEVNAINW